jgi:ABC-2 type transport system permease protein
MNKIITIIKREYKESVYKKGFIITTIIMPLLMLALIFLPALLSELDVEESLRFDVLDFSGIVYEKFTEKMGMKLSDGTDKYILRRVDGKENNFEQLKLELKERIISEEIDGFLIIPPNITDTSMVEFYAKNVGNFDLNRQIQNTINQVVIDFRIQQSGLQKEIIDALTKRVEFKTLKIQKGVEEKEGGFIVEYFSTFAFVMILYVTILIYGASIMRGVIQEKTTRIIEVLLASANSFQLMVGKILGLGSVGLTQYLIWTICGLGIMLFAGNLTSLSSDWFVFSPVIFIYFILFFILGYFLFATVYAAIGALTNSDQEAQQLSTPVVLLLIVPIVMMTFVVKNPDSTASVVFSMIPFFAPMLMFARVNISSPPLVEVWGSIILLVITIFLLIWLVAKIYRIGILMYGKRPNLPEIIKWITTK